MKKAYELLNRARALTDKTNKNGVSIATMAKEAGISDSTLRRILKPDTKHQTLDMLGAIEPVIERIEAEINSAKNAKVDSGAASDIN